MVSQSAFENKKRKETTSACGIVSPMKNDGDILQSQSTPAVNYNENDATTANITAAVIDSS